ncbi:MAG: sulfatase-like hydrolase/transferase, partial [Puniceicoccaceae bacterium]
MTTDRTQPNILLVTTDQHRGDCLGLEGHPVLQTPCLDALGREGIHFRSAYCEHPQCIPARRTLMTGQTATRHGVLFNFHAPLDGPYLADELTKAGYHTHLVGKLHLHPQRKLYGFMSADWSDGPYAGATGDYGRWLESQGVPARRMEAHGANVNGWVARPWHLDERFHFTNWATERALDFLERRDPTTPFFL